MPTTDPFHALVLLNAVFACATWSLAKPSWAAAIALTTTSILWLFFNHPIEGRVLYSINYRTGLTESDFVSAAGLLLAAFTAMRVKRSRTVSGPQRDGASDAEGTRR